MRLDRLIVLVLLLQAGISPLGQMRFDPVASPSKDQIARWLQSGDPQERAWGAFYAVKLKDESFLPVLEGVARRWVPLPSGSAIVNPLAAPKAQLSQQEVDDRDAMTAVLDGIIVLKGQIPVDDLAKLAGTFPVQTGILLARLPRAAIEQELFTLYRNSEVESLQRRIAAEMLAENPPPTFAASLLHGFTVLVAVRVHAPGEQISHFYGSSSCGYLGDNTDVYWPLVGQYTLGFDQPKPEVDVFPVAHSIRGANPVFALRREGTRTQPSTLCASNDMLSDRNRLEIIAKMLGVKVSTIFIPPVDEASIAATDTEDYTRQVLAFVKRKEDQFLRLEMQLEAAGAVTQEEIHRGDARPELLLSLSDLRAQEHRTFDLPEFLFDRAGVSWTKPNRWF